MSFSQSLSHNVILTMSFSQRILTSFTTSFSERLSQNDFRPTSFSQRFSHNVFLTFFSHNVFLTTSFEKRLSHNVFLTASFSQRLSHNIYIQIWLALVTKVSEDSFTRIWSDPRIPADFFLNIILRVSKAKTDVNKLDGRLKYLVQTKTPQHK